MKCTLYHVALLKFKKQLEYIYAFKTNIHEQRHVPTHMQIANHLQKHNLKDRNEGRILDELPRKQMTLKLFKEKKTFYMQLRGGSPYVPP